MTTIGHADGKAITIDAARLIGTRMLIQANSGGGKSWMLRVLCERLGRSTPLIVLDWEGEFASLREKLDVLLVGREGEVPTAVATAGALATQVLEIGVSVVIDLYDLKPGDKRAYVRRFLESLMAAPKRLWSPRIIVVDEAHNLCPEKGDAESENAVTDLATAGRKRQFCAILATQRLSKLAKDAAAELNNNLIGRCALDVDQKRAADILGMSKADWPRLRDMEAGEFFAFGPAFNFKGVQLIKSADVETTHGAKAGATAKPPEPSARMSRVVVQLKDLAERAKTEVLDLDSARSTIQDLRRQLKAKPQATVAVAAPDERAVGRAVNERDKFWKGEVGNLNKAVSLMTTRLGKIAELAHLNGDMPKLAEPPKAQATTPPPMSIATPRPPRENAQPEGVLPKGERKILTACAMFDGGLERQELTVLTGLARSTRDRYIQYLAARGYVTGDARIVATESGIDALGNFEPLPTGDALMQWWRPQLPDGERRLLDVLAAAWPRAVARESLSEETGLARSTRDRYLQYMACKRLVDTSGDGVKASDALFDGVGA